MINPFFKNNGPFDISDIFRLLKINNPNKYSSIEIKDIKDLISAEENIITFFHSKNYAISASTTTASFCITTQKLANILPKTCNPIIVSNVLVATSIITNLFYPKAITDDFDDTVKYIEDTIFDNKTKHGKNILIGKNVKIGKNCLIGHNSIIERNVIIGDNCSIGSNVIIRNTLIKNNVSILDGCVIGKKGFGFFPNNKKILDTLILE